MGANTIVTEVNPTRALEAAMDGHRVMSMSEASKIGDVFITLTGCMNVISKSHFELMKNTSLFVNNGRGSTVDEKYLIEAIKNKWIAGAALDVLEQEPPDPKNPLLNLENVILTPHVASASSRFDPARRRRMGVEVSLVLSGRWPTGCVNPEVLQNSNLKPWQPYSSK